MNAAFLLHKGLEALEIGKVELGLERGGPRRLERPSRRQRKRGRGGRCVREPSERKVLRNGTNANAHAWQNATHRCGQAGEAALRYDIPFAV